MTSTADDTGSATPAPPNDLQAEKFVLAACMLSKDAIADIVEILQSKDFYDPTHAGIYDAILELYGNGQLADAPRVAQALAEDGRLQQRGGMQYLEDIVKTMSPGIAAVEQAKRVADSAVRRQLLEVARKIGLLALSDKYPTQDVVDLVQEAVFGLTSRDPYDDLPEAYVNLLQPILDEVESVASLDGAYLNRILTGFTDLDRLLNGLRPGQLIVIGGRPGMGKTTLAFDILRSAAFRQNKTAAIFTRESSAIDVGIHITSAESRVPSHVLRSGLLSDDDWTKLARRMGEIIDAKLFIDARVRTIAEIRAKSRRLKAQHNLGLIVVDYIQLFAKGFHDRYREVADVSRDLKDLARELEVPVIAVSQLNRNAGQRIDPRPQLSDLRDSGTVEDDADVVILLHRDDYYNKESVRAGEADLIVAKHRHGPTDTIVVAAQLHLSRFVDMAIS